AAFQPSLSQLRYAKINRGFTELPLKRPLYCSFVIGIRFAIQKWKAIRLVEGRPDWAVGIDEKYGTEVGSLLPVAHALLTGKIDCAGKGCDPMFPVLDGGPSNAQILSPFFLREAELLAPFS